MKYLTAMEQGARLRLAAHLLTTGLAGASLFAGDLAAAATCFTLQAELTHLRSLSGGGSGDRERYQRAYEEQIEVIARTEERARDAGCFGNGSVFIDGPDASCAILVPKLREMEVNLGRLDRLRMLGDADNDERIREVEGMLADRGCGTGALEPWPVGSHTWNYDINSAYMLAGTHRTVCVRTCDGYYFPISYATTQDQFPADARACANMCPGADARLYSYPNPGGAPENMTALDGSYYTDLPTAFLYRSRVEPGCTCNAGGYTLLTTVRAEPAVEADPGARLPRPRQEPGEDPETLADRMGNFVPRVGRGEAAGDATTTAGGRTVRVIGPAFGATPEQQDALAIPIPTEPPAEN